MRKSTLVIAFLSALVPGLAGASYAPASLSSHNLGRIEGHPIMRSFRMADTNSDGFLTRSEINAWIMRSFNFFDQNNDLLLTAQDFATPAVTQAYSSAGAQYMFRAIDQTGHGKVDYDQYQGEFGYLLGQDRNGDNLISLFEAAMLISPSAARQVFSVTRQY